MTACDWCSKEIRKQPNKNKDALKHFCCKDHFTKYRRKFNYYKRVQEKKTYQKIKNFAEQRLELKKVC